MDTPKPKKPSTPSKWAVMKDRLAIASVILVTLVFAFMVVGGSLVNFQCSISEFLTFQCNRWEALF